MTLEPKSNTEIIQSPPASFAVAEFVQKVQELLKSLPAILACQIRGKE